MPRLKLWLVRHGETEVNTGGWSIKPNETRLTATGFQQAKDAAMQVVSQPDLFITSPLVRAKQTMQYFSDRWTNTPVSILAIQEFVYLSPSKLALLTKTQRRERVQAYWQRNDPEYCDGDDSESFSFFLQRVAAFYDVIMQQQGYVIAVGHGQFFKAFQLGLTFGFQLNTGWMQLFREQEIAAPFKNGAIFQKEWS